MPSTFSAQQTIAACNIRRAFLLRKLRYAILMARCQSGKTGAYHALIKKMLEAGDIQRVYIVCGSNETILRSQAFKDARTHNPDHMEAGRIQIIFRQDFKDASMDVTNALIILDESHLDQTKGQEVHKFFGRHGITMDGNPSPLSAKNTYIVSVDATPYSEIAALLHKQTPFEKHVEFLKTGAGYVGIIEYEICGALRSTYDITAGAGRTAFRALVASKDKKYLLMRLASTKHGGAAEDVVRALCIEKGYSLLSYISGKSEIAITSDEQAEILADDKKLVPCLEEAPAVTTIVIIKGRLRAGKVVPKPHIGFVWEGSKESNTDVLVQGLAGRMCGYHRANPLLFVPPSSLAEHRGKVIVDSEFERAMAENTPLTILPRKATNIMKGTLATAPSHGKTQCTPLRMEWPAADSDLWTPEGAPPTTPAEKALIAGHARDLLVRNLHLVDACHLYTPEQKAEIKALATTATPHGRHMVDESQLSYFKELVEAYANGTTPAENIEGCPSMTFVVTYTSYEKGLSIPGTNVRHVYAVFYTEAGGLADRSPVHLLSRIPKTNSKSIYSFDRTVFDRPVAAAGAVGIAVDDIKTPEKFEACLREYLMQWATSRLVYGREIKARDGGSFPLCKRQYNFTSRKDNELIRICARLEVEVGLNKNQLVVTFDRCSTHTFKVKSISW